MTSNEILRADVLDILFDNRNKQYGAYVLRKNYNSRLSAALGISLSAMMLFFFLMRIDGPSKAVTQADEKDVVVIDHVIPPDIKKADPIIPKKTIPTPQIRTESLTNPIIKEDDIVKNIMAEQDELSRSLISNRNAGGEDYNDMPIIKQAPPEEIPVKKEVERTVAPEQHEPEFPGGADAWINFLRRNLVPPAQLEPGDKKIVSIRFYVSADGTVTDFEVMQSAGKVFDNEVIRVLKKMPKWKPAIQNGQPVARAFTQPVTFIGVEE